MARLEYKYFIPFESIDNLRNDILPYLTGDNFSKDLPNNEYTVRSIYLDSPGMLTYFEKIDGVKKRNKFRIRGYNEKQDDSIVFLEIKRKDVDYVSKDRVPVLYKDLNEFLKTKDNTLIKTFRRDFADTQSSVRNFFYYYYLHSLKPVVVVTYEREAYECKFGSGLRITFDKNIRTKNTNSFSDLFDDNEMTLLFNDCFVLEVKYGSLLPAWLPMVMKKYDVCRKSISKYSTSIDTAKVNNCYCY